LDASTRQARCYLRIGFGWQLRAACGVLIYGSSGKCVPLGEERPKAFLMKVMENSNIKMQTDKSKCKNVGVFIMPKG